MTLLVLLETQAAVAEVVVMGESGVPQNHQQVGELSLYLRLILCLLLLVS